MGLGSHVTSSKLAVSAERATLFLFLCQQLGATEKEQLPVRPIIFVMAVIVTKKRSHHHRKGEGGGLGSDGVASQHGSGTTAARTFHLLGPVFF